MHKIASYAVFQTWCNNQWIATQKHLTVNHLAKAKRLLSMEILKTQCSLPFSTHHLWVREAPKRQPLLAQPGNLGVHIAWRADCYYKYCLWKIATMNTVYCIYHSYVINYFMYILNYASYITYICITCVWYIYITYLYMVYIICIYLIYIISTSYLYMIYTIYMI